MRRKILGSAVCQFLVLCTFNATIVCVVTSAPIEMYILMTFLFLMSLTSNGMFQVSLVATGALQIPELSTTASTSEEQEEEELH